MGVDRTSLASEVVVAPGSWRALLAAVVFVAACSDPPVPTLEEVPSTEATPAEEEPAAAVAWRLIDVPADPGALGANLVAGGDSVVATWMEPTGEGHRVRFARLRGEVWTEPLTVVEGEDLIANWADFPRAAVAGDEGVYVHTLHRAGEAPHAYEVRLARLVDGAFVALGVPHHDGTPTEHGFMSMVPDTTGVRLFWFDGRATVADGGATALYTTHVGAEIESTEERLDPRTCDCCQTDAALTSAGPIVVYRDRTGEEVRDVSSVRWVDGAFTDPSPVHEDGWEIAGCPVNGPAVAARGDDVVVTWFTGADGGSVRAAFSGDAGATFGEPLTIDAAQPPGRVDVALVDGGAAVSWLARGPEGGEVRVRFVGETGGLGAPSVVARTGTARASGFPVLARDGERLLIAYRDGASPASIHVGVLPIAALSREPVRGQHLATVEPTLRLGDRPPPARVRGSDDATLALASLARDRPLVLAFFARWCQPCRDELRVLEALRTELGDGAEVVVVSLDEGSAARAEATARRWGFGGRVLRDAGAARTLGVPPLPAVFAFDRRHRLVSRSVGRAPNPAALAAALRGDTPE